MKTSLKNWLAAGLVSAGVAGCVSTPDMACKCSADSNDCLCGPSCKCVDCVCKGAEGRWAIQRDGAFWLGIFKDANGKATASFLWGGGSPNEQQEVKIEGNTATMKQRVNGEKDPAKARYRVTTLKATGAMADVDCAYVDGNGKQYNVESFKAKRIPALPAAPNLALAQYGAALDLLADGINGWAPMSDQAPNCWTVEDGVLSNRVPRDENGKVKGHGANLMTKRADFFDFKLDYDVKVLPGCNSGVYLRGIYEIQVVDSYNQPVDCHNMAALYGRITPAVAAEKPANEWQHVTATLYKRHLTVVLNGQKIIDNQPVLGCTGGAITSDEFVPGPLYLQGDHSDADYRKIVLTPIVK